MSDPLPMPPDDDGDYDAEKQIKHGEWTITITAMSHGFSIEAAVEGPEPPTPMPSLECEDKADLQKYVDKMRAMIDTEEANLKANTEALKGIK